MNMKRKTKLKDGEVEAFWIKGERNPCGCGGNVFFVQDDGKKMYGVCSACKRDIYEHIERDVSGEWGYV